jgi:hypothetical protein
MMYSRPHYCDLCGIASWPNAKWRDHRNRITPVVKRCFIVHKTRWLMYIYGQIANLHSCLQAYKW